MLGVIQWRHPFSKGSVYAPFGRRMPLTTPRRLAAAVIAPIALRCGWSCPEQRDHAKLRRSLKLWRRTADASGTNVGALARRSTWVFLNTRKVSMRGKQGLLSVTTLIFLALSFGAAASAQAGSYHWYGQNNSTCRQIGFPGPSNFACDNINAGYLANPGDNGSGTGLQHMSFGGVGRDVQLPGGSQYCSYYNTGYLLGTQNNIDQGASTGWSPTPFYYWQEGDSVGGNVCQASGNRWGFKVSNNANNGYCKGTYASGVNRFPCGMHQYIAFDSTNNRPWSSSAFGPHASLNLANTVRLKTAAYVASGAWGYLCPVLRDRTTNNTFEYCFEQWYIGSNFPTLPNGQPDQKTACASAGNFNVDQVVTRFSATSKFANNRPGFQQTFMSGGGDSGDLTYSALISRSDLQKAIQALGPCGRSLSGNPDDYSIMGVENGLEGGNFLGAGGNNRDLRLWTTTDQLDNNETLASGETLESANGAYQAKMQPDGNLVIYSGSTPVWQSSTGQSGSRLVMQGDGNLVIYNSANQAVWSSGTFPPAGSENFLILQDDGVLALYSNGLLYWSSSAGRVRAAQVRTVRLRQRAELRSVERARSATAFGSPKGHNMPKLRSVPSTRGSKEAQDARRRAAAVKRRAHL